MTAQKNRKRTGRKKGGTFFAYFSIFFIAVLAALTFYAIQVRKEQKADYGVQNVPAWSGNASDAAIMVDQNRPSFSDSEMRPEVREEFSDLDALGRCGPAFACIGPESMPEGERGEIGSVKPSGWQIETYDFIDNGGFLYNRCHLIGWQLTGENDEPRNLITGTRFMNTEGMLPYENEVASYIRLSENHVLYRVTPVFSGNELLARGVEIEALSVEDHGAGVSFHVYCYNVQPGVEIDYATGLSRLSEEGKMMQRSIPESGDEKEPVPEAESDLKNGEMPDSSEEPTYILNTNTHRFHLPDCSGAADIKEYNRKEFFGTRDEAIAEGYVPCGMCKP